jgi:hypothetical protein
MMHDNVIYIFANVDQIQSVLPCLAHDRATIGVFFKQRIKYKSPYTNMVMFILQNLIKAPLYKNLNVTIHHQWASLFALHMNLESQIPYNNASFDNFDSNNEKNTLYTNKFNDT